MRVDLPTLGLPRITTTCGVVNAIPKGAVFNKLSIWSIKVETDAFQLSPPPPPSPPPPREGNVSGDGSFDSIPLNEMGCGRSLDSLLFNRREFGKLLNSLTIDGG